MEKDDGVWFEEAGQPSWRDIHRHEPMLDGIMLEKEAQAQKAGLLERIAMELEKRGV